MKIFSKGLQGLSSFTFLKNKLFEPSARRLDQGSYMKYLSNSFTEVV